MIFERKVRNGTVNIYDRETGKFSLEVIRDSTDEDVVLTNLPPSDLLKLASALNDAVRNNMENQKFEKAAGV